MCLPQGGDLRAALTADKEGKYGWYGRGRAVALGIAAGVASLHRHKITHRDLKSPNILLDKVPGACQRSLWHSVCRWPAFERQISFALALDNLT